MCATKISDEEKFYTLIESLQPLNAVSHIAGLLTFPEMASNTHRLEIVVSEILKRSRGKAKVNAASLHQLFKLCGNLGGSMMEDPAEDLFVTLVWFQGKNFRIFEGLWEQNGFILQRFLDVIEDMPNDGSFETIKRQVFSLLLLSEELADRCGLTRYCSGNGFPRQEIPENVITNSKKRASLVKFTSDELHRIGISIDDLRSYACTFEDWGKQSHIESGSLLQQTCPLIFDGKTVCVAFPSSISTAIRLSVIEFARQADQVNTLQESLAQQYSKLFYDTPLLGSLNQAPVRWVRHKNYLTAEVIGNVDTGTYIHFLFLADNFTDAFPDGMSGMNTFSELFSEFIEERIKKANDFCISQPDYKQGLTILATCGWGRAVGIAMPEALPENWRMEYISADHLITLSWLPEFDPLNIIRMLDHVDTLDERGIHLNNMSGFLNLYGFALDGGHYLFPEHDFDGKVISKDSPLEIMINNNSLLQLREKVAKSNDFHTVITPDGNPIVTRRYLQNSFFDTDQPLSIYASLEDAGNRILRCSYEGPMGELWLTVSRDNEENLFTAWDAFAKWLPIIAMSIESVCPNIPCKKYHWRLVFPKFTKNREVKVDWDLSRESLRQQITIELDHENNQILSDISPEVIDALYHPENIAEQAILVSLVDGIAELIGVTINSLELVQDAVKNSQTRQFQMFQASQFFDYVADSVKQPPVSINEFDDTLHRIGLGFAAQREPECEVVIGISKCTSLLNNAVDILWGNIREVLVQIDRDMILDFAYMNIESTNKDDDHWNRTVRSMLALRDDEISTLAAIAKQKYKRNSNNLTSRILIEMALCECPADGVGKKPSKLEITRLMALIQIMIEIGGWSDGIQHGALRAEVKITSLGLILIDGDFHSSVIQPFASQFESRRLKRIADSYEDNFTESDTTAKSTLNSDFLDAWEKEFGLSIDEASKIIESIEDAALEQHKAVITLSQSTLLSLASKATSATAASAFAQMLILRPRDRWDDFNDEVSDKDVVPWRYRRKLSLTSRPIAALDTYSDPKCYLAPRAIRESVYYLVHSSYYGTFDPEHFSSIEMSKWIGSIRNRAGHAFNTEVAERLKELGWQVHCEIDLPHLLQMKLDQDYGDVDVLAWHTDSKRVIVMECKDLYFAKNPSEIAKQLKEFRGDYSTDGEPDRLRRHLNRIDVLQANKNALQKFLGLDSIRLESALTFKNPVPITFTQIEPLKSMHMLIFDELAIL